MNDSDGGFNLNVRHLKESKEVWSITLAGANQAIEIELSNQKTIRSLLSMTFQIRKDEADQIISSLRTYVHLLTYDLGICLIHVLNPIPT